MATVERESLTAQRTHRPPETVVTCYSVIDDFFSVCGIYDLTEGMFFDDSNVSLEEAQANQIEYLLDQVECEPGSRILDVGCGYGTLVARAESNAGRGVAAAADVSGESTEARFSALQAKSSSREAAMVTWRGAVMTARAVRQPRDATGT